MRRAALLAAVALAGCGGDDLGGDFGTYTDCAEVGQLEAVSDARGDVEGAPPSADLTGAAFAAGRGKLCARFTTRERATAGTAFVLELRPRDDPAGPLVALEASVLAGAEPEVRVRSVDAGELGRVVEGAQVGTDGTALSLAVPVASLTGATDRAVAEAPEWTVRVISTDGDEDWEDRAPERPAS